MESVVEHIYGCQKLAYAIHSEFDYEIYNDKVIIMLPVREIGDVIIVDITPEDMPSIEKNMNSKQFQNY